MKKIQASKPFCFFFVALPLGLAACKSSSPSNKTDQSITAKKRFGTWELHQSHVASAHLVAHEYRHTSNGLTALLVPQKSPTVVVATAYNVGSRFEVKNRTGLAHLFEHMMFRGTKSYPKPDALMSRWGNKANAFTSPDVTLYFQLVPSQFLGEVLAFEAERMRYLSITEEGFEQERGAVVSERKMRTEDSPFGRLFWELYQNSFTVHPYKTGPIGWQEDLDATSFQDALDFYKRFYAPNRAAIAIVGGFNMKDALKLLDENYGAFERQPWNEPTVVQEPPRRGTKRVVIPFKSEVVYLGHSFTQSPTHSQQREAALESLVCSLFANPDFGLLGEDLVDRGLASTVSPSCSPNVDPSLSSAFIVAQKGIGVKAIESALDKSMRRFSKWLSNEKLQRIKPYYTKAQWQNLRDPMQLGIELLQDYMFAGNPFQSMVSLGEIQRATLQDVLRHWSAMQRRSQTRVILQPAAATQAMTRETNGN